jgi:hypothetical protein
LKILEPQILDFLLKYFFKYLNLTGWQRYEEHLQQDLEKYFNNTTIGSKHLISINAVMYEIDFGKMKQTRIQDITKVRKIKRETPLVHKNFAPHTDLPINPNTEANTYSEFDVENMLNYKVEKSEETFSHKLSELFIEHKFHCGTCEYSLLDILVILFALFLYIAIIKFQIIAASLIFVLWLLYTDHC